jgi:Ca-activated chloride channel family protein
MKQTIFLASTIILATFSTFAQNDTINVETNLVTLNVAVTDKSGNFVRGLTKNDFTVMDEGTLQPIEIFSANDAALSIGIVYDMHQMDDSSASVLEALKRFTGRLVSQDDYFVSIYNDKGSLTADFVPDADQVRRHLADPDRGTPNSLYDSIIAAGEKVKELRNAKKYLIVFSDGADKNSQHSMKELQFRLRSVNLPLYALTLTRDDMRRINYVDIARNGPRQTFRVGEVSDLDKSVLAELSKSTGGQAFESSIRDRVYLAALATKFLEEARSQYVVGFSANSNDGRWHKLKVTVKSDKAKGVRISSRKGYQSSRTK